MVNQTRGERNKNPGNIDRNGAKWQGMADDQSGDKRFIVFSEPVWGIRALAKVLLTYQKKGINTVRGMIHRWAPPVENNTDAYVSAVSCAVGCQPDDPIDATDPLVLTPLVKAIIKHENGRVIYADAVIADAVERSLHV